MHNKLTDMNKRNIYSLVVFVFFLCACQSKDKNQFTVRVVYKNAHLMPKTGNTSAALNRQFYLEEIPYGGDNNPIVLDTVTTKDQTGSITLKGTASEQGIFQLGVVDGPGLLLVNDANDIKVTIDLAKKDHYYTVEGSPASASMQQFIDRYGEKGFEVNKCFNEIDSLKQVSSNDSLILLATERKNAAVASLNQYVKKEIENSSFPAYSLFLLGMSARSLVKADFEKIMNETVQKFPTHAALAKLKTTYDKQQRERAEIAAGASSSWIGKQAPAFTMNDMNDKPVSLSDFKGKYVLVDFWASWCGPCRMENPNVVKAYQKYKDKNFTILGVSLDKNKDKWVEAILADGLNWMHVSDLQFWNSQAVKVFHFDGIPYNVLIDPNGKIIAESLRGDALQAKLKELLP
jgi:thiol-disulfide isomerase/thioredoxin